MHDPEIRELLRRWINTQSSSYTGTIIEELGLARGAVRVDMAIAASRLVGFEIKSDFDSFRRLPDQVEVCGMIMEEMWLVVGPKHVRKARRAIPIWWGLMKATPLGLQQLRQARSNPNLDKYALAEVLWREEALDLLSVHGLDRGMRSKPHAQICVRLAAELSVAELATTARTAIKRRARLRDRVAA